MKLYLMALSFYPLLLTFLIAVWFRINILSSAMLFIMISWTMLMPFLIVFVGTVLLTKKKEDSPDKEGGT